MRLKLYIVDDVVAIFVLVIFYFFHIVWNDIVILQGNRANYTIYPGISSGCVTSAVDWPSVRAIVAAVVTLAVIAVVLVS